MKKVLLTAGICLFAGSVFAQMKNVNAAFNEAKMPKPNFGEARKSINEALKNPDTKDLAKTCRKNVVKSRKSSAKASEKSL